mgnify:CR=1 FL=1
MYVVYQISKRENARKYRVSPLFLEQNEAPFTPLLQGRAEWTENINSPNRCHVEENVLREKSRPKEEHCQKRFVLSKGEMAVHQDDKEVKSSNRKNTFYNLPWEQQQARSHKYRKGSHCTGSACLNGLLTENCLTLEFLPNLHSLWVKQALVLYEI